MQPCGTPLLDLYARPWLIRQPILSGIIRCGFTVKFNIKVDCMEAGGMGVRA